MNILFVTPGLPSRCGGGAQRMFYMLKYLSAAGNTIDLLSLAQDSAHHDDLRALCREVRVVETRDDFKSRVKNLIFLRAYMSFPRFRQELNRLNPSEYDLIHVHKFQMAQYFRGVREAPVLIDLWACGLRGVWGEVLHEGNIGRKLVRLSRVPRFFLDDVREYRTFRNFFVVSRQAEQYVLRRYPEKRVFVVPNGVELERWAPVRTRPAENPFNLVFTGDMGFYQNVDTARYFVKKIFPLIKKEIGNVRFFIVGRSPAREVVELAKEDPAVVVTGSVQDPGEYLGLASVFVAPIRTGSGIRSKILEAMAWGLPVVTTEYALEGIEAEVGTEIVCARTASAFAGRVVDLLRDPRRREEMGKAARRVIQTKYQWSGISENIMRFYEEIRRTFRP